MKIILPLLSLILISAALGAQSCYEVALQKGAAAYNQGDYARAAKFWTTGKDCDDADVKKLNNLLWKTRDDDGDGFVNGNDNCPKQPGPKSNAGCPLPPPSPSPVTPAGMILVKGGTFTMGDEKGDGDSDAKPTHTVTIKDFYLGKYEVTNAEFVQFLNEKGNQTEGGVEWINLNGRWDDERCRISKSGSTFSVASGYENYPVIYVSWYGAMAYCNWLKQKNGGEYRLPTEAEWEYAAGNGNSHTKYSWGNDDPWRKKVGNVADLTAKAKYSTWKVFESYRDGYVYTAPVGQFDPNSFGLYDMTGNVWEWCADWYDSEYYKNSPAQNPQGATSGSYRVLRGGSWSANPRSCRVADRSWFNPASRSDNFGFRVARDY